MITEDVPMAMGRKRQYILSAAEPSIKLMRTFKLVEESLNMVIELDDLIDAGVAKKLVTGERGDAFWIALHGRTSEALGEALD